MTVRLIVDADGRAWDRYVDAHAHGTPYHRCSWADSLQYSFGHQAIRLAAMQEDRIVGVLPIVAIRSLLTGTRLISTPFAGYGGPLADSEDVADLLIERARSLAHDIGADHLALHFASSELAPPSTQGMHTTDQYWGFRAVLPADADELLGRYIPQKARRMVRLGLKAGLQAQPLAEHPAVAPLEAADVLEPRLQACYELLARTMRNLGTPVYPLAYLRQLTSRDPQRWFVFAVFDGEHIVAAVWTAAHGATLHPHFVGYDRDSYRVGVSNFLYWSLMRHGMERGFRVVDMGRSKQGSGAYDFKRNMGLEAEPLGYRYYRVGAGDMPAISPNDPRYSAAISLWRRLPLGVVKAVGPRLVGHFA